MSFMLSFEFCDKTLLEILSQYGENSMMQRKVCQWVGRFQRDRINSVYEGCSGHLTTSGAADNVERVNALVQENRRTTVTDIGDKLDISCESTYSIIHKDLEFHKICAVWVPKQLKDEHKWTDVETCNFCSNIMKERLSCNGLS
jgi:hypothetical protein